jgi:hypothetical protein
MRQSNNTITKSLVISIFIISAMIFAVTTSCSQLGTGSNPDADAVANDTLGLDYDDFIFSSPEDESTVKHDFTVPVTGTNGSTIAWSSDDEDVCCVTGGTVEVTRPSSAEADATITLTATISSGEVSATKTFTVTIIALVAAEEDIFTDMDDLSADALTFTGSDTISSVTGNITLPLSGANGTTITWAETTDDDDCSSLSGGDVTITRPASGSENGTVVLTATISKDGYSEEKTFTFTILAAHYMGGVSFGEVTGWNYTVPTENADARIFEITSTDAYSLTLVGDFAYVSFGYSAENHPIYIFDVSDPANPVAKYYLSFNKAFGEIDTAGNTVYAASGSSLYPIDVTDPENPLVCNPVTLSDSVGTMDIHGDMLVYGGTGSPGSVGTVDITNRLVPSELDNLTLSAGQFFNARYDDGYFYVANGPGADNSFAIVDATDPSALTETYMGDVGDSISYAHGVAAQDGYCYVSNGNNMVQLDVSDPSAPTLESSPSIPGFSITECLYIENDVVYGVDQGGCEVHRVDISDPADLTILTKLVYGTDSIGYYQGTGEDIAVGGGYVFLACVDAMTSGCHGFVVIPTN